MPKPRYKTTNWKQYNKALINRGSLTFWIDEEAIAEWKQNKQGKRGRPRRFSDLAITTALMVKRIFSMPLRALQGFLDSVHISEDSDQLFRDYPITYFRYFSSKLSSFLQFNNVNDYAAHFSGFKYTSSI